MQEILVDALLAVVVVTAAVLRFIVGAKADSGMTRKQKVMLPDLTKRLIIQFIQAGHNKIKEMDFPDEWAAIAWMCRKQCSRRNINELKLPGCFCMAASMSARTVSRRAGRFEYSVRFSRSRYGFGSMMDSPCPRQMMSLTFWTAKPEK